MSSKEEILKQFDELISEFEIFLKRNPPPSVDRYSRPEERIDILHGDSEPQFWKLKTDTLTLLGQIQTTNQTYSNCVEYVTHIEPFRFNVKQALNQIRDVHALYKADMLVDEPLFVEPQEISKTEEDVTIRTTHLTGRYNILIAIIGGLCLLISVGVPILWSVFSKEDTTPTAQVIETVTPTIDLTAIPTVTTGP